MNAQVTVVDSIFRNNTATAYDGGGLYASGGATISAASFSTIRPQRKGRPGRRGADGVLRPLTITNTVFSGNNSADWGGGAYIAYFANLQPTFALVNVQFVRLRANNGEGRRVHLVRREAAEGRRSTGNYSSYHGGGVMRGHAGSYVITMLRRRTSTTPRAVRGPHGDGDLQIDGMLIDHNTSSNGNGGGVWMSRVRSSPT